jgi:hypothetical protein
MTHLRAEMRVEDYAFVQGLARRIVDHALTRQQLAMMQHVDNQIRRVFGYPLVQSLTDRERAEARLRHIGTHIERCP